MSKYIMLSMGTLAISATTAFADVSFSPSATFGVKSTDAGKTWNPDASLALGVEGSVETDGLTFGGSFKIETGNLADATGTDTIGEIKDPSLFIKGSFGEVYAKENGDDEAVFGYKYDLSNTSFGLEHNWVTDVTALSLGHDFGDFSVSSEFKTNDEWNVKAAFDNGQYNASVKVDHEDVVTLTAGLSNNGFTLGTEYKTNDEWKVEAGYSFGLHSINASLEHDDDYSIGGKYGVNENLSIYLEAKVEDSDPQEIKFGATYSF